ncbi:hypothetical protein O0I10_012299 [Lichtheimia ornata]|uniref:Uncharacterized protein n=1 Tax=Lichtheimia ornata TaxID=688661 RepID=A0AAD7URA2_9FUNG|nr:uncharacterized protein O0I10_012299 [Lichtheimia ornata]KAJ8652068.1 hypothetical protein O0I10_012299 [Lichtheimia ornata]
MPCFERIPLELRGDEEVFTLRFLSTGHALQVSKEAGSAAMSFGLHRYAVDLDRLWRSERAHKENSVPIQPMVVQQPQGRSALMCGGNLSKFALPCNPQDAAYLLHQWLLNGYPEHGGEVTTLKMMDRYNIDEHISDFEFAKKHIDNKGQVPWAANFGQWQAMGRFAGYTTLSSAQSAYHLWSSQQQK